MSSDRPIPGPQPYTASYLCIDSKSEGEEDEDVKIGEESPLGVREGVKEREQDVGEKCVVQD